MLYLIPIIRYIWTTGVNVKDGVIKINLKLQIDNPFGKINDILLDVAIK